MMRFIVTSAAGLALASTAPTSSHTPPMSQSGYAPVNGLQLYYEIHGTGAPVVVLHGGLSNTEMIAGMIANLARTQRVIAVDLQGHGRTADIDRAFSCERAHAALTAGETRGARERLRVTSQCFLLSALRVRWRVGDATDPLGTVIDRRP